MRQPVGNNVSFGAPQPQTARLGHFYRRLSQVIAGLLEGPISGPSASGMLANALPFARGIAAARVSTCSRTRMRDAVAIAPERAFQKVKTAVFQNYLSHLARPP